ncbi:hypothetical protein GO755_07075 [Spirosoma sp. HMF4905]|uniref:Uncharacterized protein n=1 Tax=Spirosoma arboris TaxID=2682092 RepID=A0A7K1S7P5_9BACT|nr:hypothetical protein [Spirosoma arboris]MVM29789.1 hypothetical protein [Spirosoma arboris]
MDRLTKVGLFTLLLLAQVGFAQTPTYTKIYLFNITSGGLLKPIMLRTSLNPDNPIRIKSRECVLLETDADSLGLLVNDQVESLPFERGQTYYYVISSDYMPIFTVNEVSRRVFWLTAHVNNSQKITSYMLDKKGLSTSTR